MAHRESIDLNRIPADFESAQPSRAGGEAKTTDLAITAIKGLAIIGVVAHHLINRRFDAETNQFFTVLRECFAWCVFAFIAVSGSLNGRVEEKRTQSLAAFARSRALRLLLPFVLLILVYALIWQVIQNFSGLSLRGNLAAGYIDKVTDSLWPMGSEVAEQLYFMPLLFIISVLAQAIHQVVGRRGIIVLGLGALGAGIIWFSQSNSTGFSVGVGVWGMFSYCAGWLIHSYRNYRPLPIVVMLAASAVIGMAGLGAWSKVFAIVLLVIAPLVSLQRVPLLVKFGIASGTIFAYHTPFILQPLVLAASRLPTPPWREAGALAAGLAAMLVCTILYFLLRKTRLRVVLL